MPRVRLSHLRSSGAPCAIAWVLLVSAAGALEAQQRGGAIVVSVMTADGEPLSGARVSVQGIGIIALTDAAGTARIDDLQPGARTLEVHYLGYAPASVAVDVVAGERLTIDLILPVQPVALAPVTATARRSILYDRGFYHRKKSGQGTFIDREEIEALRPRYMSDLLRRVAGVSVNRSSFGGRARVSMRGANSHGSCPIQYYIDGTLTGPFNIDNIPPGDVEGIEIYRGAATIPVVFNKGRAICGVIVVWTRMW